MADGSIYYQIKLINRTRFDIVRIRAELLHTQEVMIPGSNASIPLFHTKPVPLKRAEILRIGRFNSRDKGAQFAFRFVAYDIEVNAKINDRFLFRVYAEHAISGYSRVEQGHYSMNLIRDGDFEGGDSLRVVPLSAPFRKPTKPRETPPVELTEILDRIRRIT
jgi:hypothetical protein